MSDIYRCKNCFSSNVQIKTWININDPTNLMTELDEFEDDDTWCIDCKDHTGLVALTLEELEQEREDREIEAKKDAEREES